MAIVKSVLGKRNAALAESFITDERNAALCKRLKLGEDVDIEVLYPEEAVGQEDVVLTVKGVTPGSVYAIPMRASAHRYFQKSHVAPVLALRAETEAQNASKKAGSVPKPAGTCLSNENTTTGLAVISSVLQTIKDKEIEKVRREQEKISNATAAAAKKRDARDLECIAAKEAADSIEVAHARGDDNAWKKMNIKLLKMGYAYMTKCDAKDIEVAIPGASLKKSDIVAAIMKHINPVVQVEAMQVEFPVEQPEMDIE
jgi:hypothetical protein